MGDHLVRSRIIGRHRKNKEAIDAIERLKEFILDDGEKRMPDATSGHP